MRTRGPILFVLLGILMLLTVPGQAQEDPGNPPRVECASDLWNGEYWKIQVNDGVLAEVETNVPGAIQASAVNDQFVWTNAHTNDVFRWLFKLGNEPSTVWEGSWSQGEGDQQPMPGNLSHVTFCFMDPIVTTTTTSPTTTTSTSTTTTTITTTQPPTTSSTSTTTVSPTTTTEATSTTTTTQGTTTTTMVTTTVPSSSTTSTTQATTTTLGTTTTEATSTTSPPASVPVTSTTIPTECADPDGDGIFEHQTDDPNGEWKKGDVCQLARTGFSVAQITGFGLFWLLVGALVVLTVRAERKLQRG